MELTVLLVGMRWKCLNDRDGLFSKEKTQIKLSVDAFEDMSRALVLLLLSVGVTCARHSTASHRFVKAANGSLVTSDHLCCLQGTLYDKHEPQLADIMLAWPKANDADNMTQL
jgi:hypothetical protein